MAHEIYFRQCTLTCGAVRTTSWIAEKHGKHTIEVGTTLSLDGDSRIWSVDEMSDTRKSRDDMIGMRTGMKVFGPSLRGKERIT